MVNVNMNEREFLKTIKGAEMKLRQLFICKCITEGEFRKRLKTVNKAKVYYKLNLLNFTEE